MDTQEAKGKGTPNKGTLQSYIQNFTQEAIDVLVEIMRTSRNENLKMGAAKVIIDKSIADLKAMEVTGQDGEPIKITVIGGGFVPESRFINAASTASTFSATTVQSDSLAPESPQDNNSDNRDDPSSSS